MSGLSSPDFKKAALEIAEAGLFLAQKGWSPATSSNYSIKLSEENMALTRSGVDKYSITESDVIIVDMQGQVVAPTGERPSAETLIHAQIYKKRPEARAVLHTHSPLNTRLSIKHAAKERLEIANYEMLKGLEGNKTHNLTELIPILPNNQDMVAFCRELAPILSLPQIHGFLIAGHGLYTWGQDMKSTRRHIETFEFLFECVAYDELGI